MTKFQILGINFGIWLDIGLDLEYLFPSIFFPKKLIIKGDFDLEWKRVN